MRLRLCVKIAAGGDGVRGDGGFKVGSEEANIRSGSRKLDEVASWFERGRLCLDARVN